MQLAFIGYSCEKQQTYRILFDKHVMLTSGSSSDAGSSGQNFHAFYPTTPLKLKLILNSANLDESLLMVKNLLSITSSLQEDDTAEKFIINF